MGASDGVQAVLRRAAAADYPDGVAACVDEDAFERAEGVGSPAEAEALKRRDAEAWIPGLAARPAVMAMSWSIAVAVGAATALSWLPQGSFTDTIGSTAEIGGCAVAVAAAAWGILSEVRGWEGSDASRWLLKRRVKAFGRALEARRRQVCGSLVVITTDTVVVYAIDAGAPVARPFPADAVLGVTLEPRGDHMVLRLVSRNGERLFEWLNRDAALESAVERFARRVATKDVPAAEPA